MGSGPVAVGGYAGRGLRLRDKSVVKYRLGDQHHYQQPWWVQCQWELVLLP